MTRTKFIFAVVLAVLFGISLGSGSPLHLLRRAEAAPKPPAEVPKFAVDPLWPKPFRSMWVTGDVAGTCVDAQDHVFIVNQNNLTPDEIRNSHPSPAIIEFDPEGTVVNSWGEDRKSVV